ncbi:MAG: sugar transferase [Desulfobacterales bacterium]|jgi:exopolysaccharide biosynthesis polyprenyl glycosylphosphotransferase|nr:sugar transferase [Desulfobacterales bacterium]
MLRGRGELTTRVQKTLDLVITALSFIAAYHIKNFFLPTSLRGLSSNPNYYIVLLLIIIVWYISFAWMGMYISYRESQFWQFFVRITKSVLLGVVILSISLYVFHIQGISRMLVGIFIFLNILLLTASKYIIYIGLKRLRARGINTRNVLIIGSRERAVDAVKSIENNRGSGYKVLGCFDLDEATIGKPVVNGHQVIGCMAGLEAYLKDNVVDELLFAMPLKLIENAAEYLSMAESMGVKVRIIPDWQLDKLMYRPGIANIRIEDFLGLHTLALQTTPPNEAKLFIKAVGDHVVALIMMVLCLPLFVLVGLAIKLVSKGPVFFRQERLGLNGRKFILYKFRTMVNDADALKQELTLMNEADGPAFKIKDDPRIIPWVGTFLRKTSLDELPQLINVIKGEMSLVGPRPPIPSEVTEYSIWQRRRLSMKPGLTCYWQIAPQRNDMRFDEWMRLDLQYIDTWSLFNDLRLLLLTVRVVLMGSGR